jgi:hypothetical protein
MAWTMSMMELLGSARTIASTAAMSMPSERRRELARTPHSSPSSPVCAAKSAKASRRSRSLSVPATARAQIRSGRSASFSSSEAWSRSPANARAEAIREWKVTARVGGG